MLIDLHTHTCRYSACSNFTPQSMVRGAIAAGLDGMVITEHDHIWGKDEIEELRAEFPEIKIFRGIEVSCGLDHFLVYGVLEEGLFYRDMPVRKLLDIVDERGGCVVLAHAYRYYDGVPDTLFETPTIDAIEFRSSNIRRYTQEPLEQLAQRLKVPKVAGSDGHAETTIGMFATRFPQDIANEQELVAAIKAGEMEIHVNEERVGWANAKIEASAHWVKGLLAGGADPEEIRRRHKVSKTLVYALTNHLDVRV